MSRLPYRAARRGRLIFLALLMPMWLTIGLLGAAKYDAFYFGSIAFWLAVMVWVMLAFRCPKCRHSLFVSRWRGLNIGHPWVNRRCARCGADLTV